jgi:hypothetical protein
MGSGLISRADRRPNLKRIASEALRIVGSLILVAAFPIVFGFAVPAPGYEWLKSPHLTVAAVACIFGSILLSGTDQSRGTKLMAAAVVILAAFTIIRLAVKHQFGV